VTQALQSSPFVPAPVPATSGLGWQNGHIASIFPFTETSPEYVRERILKPAGYFFEPQQGAVL
jgi:hypothetical protein